ncbi:CDP-glycerol glycerophosphotransferase family protein [Vagococcus coleopterorum]|uniref:CDP-glycerol glycerophosphotransferase family protein n=1 Tax=Vagococcus coleopterorum TaxID=2714946 RepID=A0A6G8ALI9_9ENTE|nr:CDP-glycerol glycerophosphotransferase family protein [Vagococcus coleopterorum]QIL45795.1 CDP-glycerol glycerophosphotransferase family protein [Vagococcus coleopterorum]
MSAIKNKYRKYSIKFKRKIVQFLSWLFSKCLNRDDNMIYFESFLGRQYSDNPRAIYEYINKEYPEYKCYWGMDSRFFSKFDDLGLNTVPKISIKGLYIIAKSKYWVTNSRVPLWVTKPSDTIYLQTWHGTPLKKLAIDMDDENIPDRWNRPIPYKEAFSLESDRWDYMISPNKYSTEIFKRCFNFNNAMLETGYPRNDYLTTSNNQEHIDEIKQKLGLPLDKKIILYAPTWRDYKHYELELDLQRMQEEIGDDYYIIFRLHYLVLTTNDISEDNSFIKNVSSYNEISELYLISDLLITDYSSVFFDYAILKRPMIFYCYDLEEYKNDLRGFYFDFEKDAPGPIVQTEDELIKAIKNSDEQKVSKGFGDQFTSLEDGYATKRVVERMLNKKNQ